MLYRPLGRNSRRATLPPERLAGAADRDGNDQLLDAEEASAIRARRSGKVTTLPLCDGCPTTVRPIPG